MLPSQEVDAEGWLDWPPSSEPAADAELEAFASAPRVSLRRPDHRAIAGEYQAARGKGGAS